ncbi:MAG TPA: hypothetical protein VNW90_10370 [Acetobacteraceae bacterium]|nr:hypothetical protein [Acetobacteraceae bacterium]
MLSPASLAAFSTSPTQSGSGAMRPVQRVRAVVAQPAQPAAPVATASPRNGEGDTTPNRILPRGSLLDLSV